MDGNFIELEDLSLGDVLPQFHCKLNLTTSIRS